MWFWNLEEIVDEVIITFLFIMIHVACVRSSLSKCTYFVRDGSVRLSEALVQISTFLGSKLNADFDVKFYVKISSPFGNTSSILLYI